MGVNASHPCHACNIRKEDQCEIARTNSNVQDLMRDYGSLLNDTILGCTNRYIYNDHKAAQKIQTQTGFYNTCLPPAMWSKFFDPTKQTPPCLMHNGPLGLIRTMVQQFAEIHGKAFVDHVNAAASNLCKFKGVPQAPHGIFCVGNGARNKERRHRFPLRKLNADQMMGFARSSPAFVWQVLPKAHFELWILVLTWFLTLYVLES
jgi:hypothetical protein